MPPAILPHTPITEPTMPPHERLTLLDERLRVEAGIVDVASTALAQHAFQRFADELHPTYAARLTRGVRAVYRAMFDCWQKRATDRAVVQVMDVLGNQAGRDVALAFAALSPVGRYRVAQAVWSRAIATYHATLEQDRPFPDGPLMAVTEAQASESRMVSR